MNRNQRRAKAEKRRMKYERWIKPKIYAALQAPVEQFINDIRTVGINAALISVNSTAYNNRVASTLIDLYQVAGTQAAAILAKKIKVKSKKGSEIDPAWSRQITEYLMQHLYDKIVLPISDTTKEKLNNYIQQMIEQGESIDWLVEKMRREDFNKYRSEMIARTESNRAIHAGEKVVVEESDYVMKKEWVSVHDNRTRHSHLALDGQVKEDDEKFSNGLDYPCDPDGSASETINCRCHLNYELKRDKSRNLVQKDNNTQNNFR